jgi:uncharacterized protein YdeI (YjbR/CyaY-like superfamily)
MPKASKHDGYPILEFENKKSFEKWLAKNHAKEEGVWLKISKSKSGIKSVNHNEALEVALCYGWIDGQRNGLDENYFMQKFTPRRGKSIWSVINKQKVTKLIKEGNMKPAGLAAINEAKKNGRWDSAYESQSAITIPADLQKALDEHPKAKAFFATLNSQNRYSILFRLKQLKREETKKKRIGEYIVMLEKHETIYPQR